MSGVSSRWRLRVRLGASSATQFYSLEALVPHRAAAVQRLVDAGIVGLELESAKTLHLLLRTSGPANLHTSSYTFPELHELRPDVLLASLQFRGRPQN